MAGEINPDLLSERRKSSFDVTELTHLLDGGEDRTRRRKELESFLFSDPLFKLSDAIYQSRAELYSSTVERSVKLYRLKRQLQWSDSDFKLAIKIIRGQDTFTLHSGVFIPALLGLATPEQRAKWLEPAANFQFLGAYAQTELGHDSFKRVEIKKRISTSRTGAVYGSNLLGLETTATYDHTTEEFILNTPKLSSIKWWPGAMARTSNFCVLMAQLIMKGKNYGMQPFIVQLRSLKDHKPLRGIEVGDIGPKLGVNYSDNGYLFLKNVRIPRTNMLMRNAQVSRDGTFKSGGPSKANYSTMTKVRTLLCEAVQLNLSHAITVAVRYSAVRRQSTLKPGSQEIQVLDYQTQQYKLFPALAASYAFFLIKNRLSVRLTHTLEKLARGDASHFQELHICSSGMKALTSDIATAEIEVCRRSCGGHGYLLAAGIADYLSTASQVVTGEGENTVLYLQVGRYLIKQMTRVVSGQKVQGSAEYLTLDAREFICPIQRPSDCRNIRYLCDIYRKRAYGIILAIAKRMQTDRLAGMTEDVVLNNSLQPLVRAAMAHSYFLAVSYIVEGLLDLNVSPPVKRVITDLCCFFAIHYIVKISGDFLETDAIGLEQLQWLEKAELQLLSDIRPEAVGLVDAFDIHDETLCSALGSYDGRVYERLYESALKSPMNKNEVDPSYHTHLRHLMMEGANSKL